MKPPAISRRRLLKVAGPLLLANCFTRGSSAAQTNPWQFGVVIGQAEGEKVGMQVLADGGNAFDAIVAAALTAAIAAPSSTGIGGYGMSATLASHGGKRIVSIDGNTTAPLAMPADLFQPGPGGKLPDGLSNSNWLSSTGWLSAGVPGILAGLQLIIDTFGTRGFGELVQPAIALARNGLRWPSSLANVVERSRLLRADPGSYQLFYPGDKAAAAGELFRNPELADMLAELARANSVDAFYRGDIALRIAEGFAKNGGLVTAQDMAAYQARLVEPLSLPWGSRTVHTAPLSAGGLSVLQMLHVLKSMQWQDLPEGVQKTQAKVEAMRLAWRDRVTLLGDPDHSQVPTDQLLSAEYASDSAEKIMSAIKAGKMLPSNVQSRPQNGTIHLSAADRLGNFVALTLTHGNGFGACVTVEGLGLTLGHGMSRFDPDPTHPNAPGPGKRPLHNMVPSIVTEDGLPILAVGGTGGRKIPNALFELLTQFVALGKPLEATLAAPRLHSEGDDALVLEKNWPAIEVEQLRQFGYKISQAGSATMNAVSLVKGEFHAGKR